MKINKCLIIILARKGSIRLKDKNVKKLGAKKLIEHTIDYAKIFNNKCNIILSTDDRRIIKIAKKKKYNMSLGKASKTIYIQKYFNRCYFTLLRMVYK